MRTQPARGVFPFGVIWSLSTENRANKSQNFISGVCFAPERLVLIFTSSQRPINLTLHPLSLRGAKETPTSAGPRAAGCGPGGRSAYGLPRRPRSRLPGGCRQIPPRCLGPGTPRPPPPPPRGKSPAPPVNFPPSGEPGEASHPPGNTPTPPSIPTGTPMTDFFTVTVLLDNARFPRNYGRLGCAFVWKYL